MIKKEVINLRVREEIEGTLESAPWIGRREDREKETIIPKPNSLNPNSNP